RGRPPFASALGRQLDDDPEAGVRARGAGELRRREVLVVLLLLEHGVGERPGGGVGAAAQHGQRLAVLVAEVVAGPLAAAAGQVAGAVGADVVAVGVEDGSRPLAAAIDGHLLAASRAVAAGVLAEAGGEVELGGGWQLAAQPGGEAVGLVAAD